MSCGSNVWIPDPLLPGIDTCTAGQKSDKQNQITKGL